MNTNWPCVYSLFMFYICIYILLPTFYILKHIKHNKSSNSIHIPNLCMWYVKWKMSWENSLNRQKKKENEMKHRFLIPLLTLCDVYLCMYIMFVRHCTAYTKTTFCSITFSIFQNWTAEKTHFPYNTLFFYCNTFFFYYICVHSCIVYIYNISVYVLCFIYVMYAIYVNVFMSFSFDINNTQICIIV